MKYCRSIYAGIILLSVLTACTNQSGPLSEEDYSGIWTSPGGRYGHEEQFFATDTTFEYTMLYEGEGIPIHKGFIKKESDNQILIVTTHVWAFDDGYTVENDVFRLNGNADGEYMSVPEHANTNSPEYHSYVTRETMEYSISGDIMLLGGMPFNRSTVVSSE